MAVLKITQSNLSTGSPPKVKREPKRISKYDLVDPLIIVDAAPENTRRVYGCIDIHAETSEVWKVITNYHHLHEYVPSMIENKILTEFDEQDNEEDDEIASNSSESDVSITPQEMFEQFSKQKRGVLAKQTGGAKLLGMTFTAGTTLVIREWPTGMNKEFCEPLSSDENRQRGIFPEPFTVEGLSYRDVSMQNAPEYGGAFRSYQGVFRVQSISQGENMEPITRLSYAAECTPQPHLPVRLIEGRIAGDLSENLKALKHEAETQKSHTQ